jgi:hypothetical protein
VNVTLIAEQILRPRRGESSSQQTFDGSAGNLLEATGFGLSNIMSDENLREK